MESFSLVWLALGLLNLAGHAGVAGNFYKIDYPSSAVPDELQLAVTYTLWVPGDAVPAADYKGDPKQAVWLPNAAVARDWMEYVKTGQVGDTTPPPAPFNVKAEVKSETETVITWEAEADMESGIGHFIVLRDGQELGNLPAVNQVRFHVHPMFQAGWMNSYGDAPATPAPEMRFVDPWPKDREKHA